MGGVMGHIVWNVCRLWTFKHLALFRQIWSLYLTCTCSHYLKMFKYMRWSDSHIGAVLWTFGNVKLMKKKYMYSETSVHRFHRSS